MVSSKQGPLLCGEKADLAFLFSLTNPPSDAHSSLSFYSTSLTSTVQNTPGRSSMDRFYVNLSLHKNKC